MKLASNILKVIVIFCVLFDYFICLFFNTLLIGTTANFNKKTLESYTTFTHFLQKCFTMDKLVN